MTRIRIIKAVMILLEKISPYYLSVNTRIKSFHPDNLRKYPVYQHLNEAYAIIMQGPVITKDNFTLETLSLYRHVYPGIQIILSTWHIDDLTFIGKLDKLRIRLIENEKPGIAGAFNINLQITTTANALKTLDPDCTRFVLKTRTDQRCCKAVDFLGYLHFLQTYFPLRIETAIEQRLVIISLDTLQKRLYGITDMFMFGTLSDMKKYWMVPLDPVREVSEVIPVETMIQYHIGEGYFVNHFFNTLDYKPDWSTADSDRFLAQYFCIADKEQFDLFWFKYNRHFDSIIHFKEPTYFEWIRREFSDWIRLQ